MGIEKEVFGPALTGRDPREYFEKEGLIDALKKALSDRRLSAELDHQQGRAAMFDAINAGSAHLPTDRDRRPRDCEGSSRHAHPREQPSRCGGGRLERAGELDTDRATIRGNPPGYQELFRPYSSQIAIKIRNFSPKSLR